MNKIYKINHYIVLGNLSPPSPANENKESSYSRQEKASDRLCMVRLYALSYHEYNYYSKKNYQGFSRIIIFFHFRLWDTCMSNNFVIFELWLQFMDEFIRITHSINYIYYFSSKQRLYWTGPVPNYHLM